MHSAHAGLKLTQTLLHPPVLLGMGAPANLRSKPGRLSGVVPPQGNVVVCCKLDQLLSAFLERPAIRGMHSRFEHHR